ncbi:hypothetical protein NX059_005176 [Plenodomus lindquistii]|nr:hypothetical protein NX059_005176 [Plenodomus lindquistii]
MLATEELLTMAELLKTEELAKLLATEELDSMDDSPTDKELLPIVEDDDLAAEDETETEGSAKLETPEADCTRLEKVGDAKTVDELLDGTRTVELVLRDGARTLELALRDDFGPAVPVLRATCSRC